MKFRDLPKGLGEGGCPDPQDPSPGPVPVSFYITFLFQQSKRVDVCQLAKPLTSTSFTLTEKADPSDLMLKALGTS